MANRLPRNTNRRQRRSEIEKAYDLRRFLEEVNRTIPTWPLNEKDVHVDDTPRRVAPHRDSIRVVAWAIAFALVAVTSYGIAVGNDAILKAVLGVAAAWMLRLIRWPGGAGDRHGKRSKEDSGSRSSREDPGDT